MPKKTYIAEFSYGPVKRTTENRTYAAAWSIAYRPDSDRHTAGFSRDHALAEKQITTYRNRGYTGPSEIVPALLKP